MLNKEDLKSHFSYKGEDIREILSEKIEYIFSVEFPKYAGLIDGFRCMLDKVRPLVVVVDEDVCPFNKTLVQVAKTMGIKSSAVQHGMMGMRPGFIPLSADYFLCWGSIEPEKMKGWGVGEDRILIAGSPRHDVIFSKANSYNAPKLEPEKGVKVLYINSPFHERWRPDFLNSHISQDSHFRTLKTLGDLKEKYPTMKLAFKFHPRDLEKDDTKKVLRSYFNDDVSFHEKNDLYNLIMENDIVIAAWSSACLEALMFGKRLIVVNFESALVMFPIGDKQDAWRVFNEQQLIEKFDKAISLSAEELTNYHARVRSFIERVFHNRDGSATDKASLLIEEIGCLK